jgi:hypothetical protein
MSGLNASPGACASRRRKANLAAHQRSGEVGRGLTCQRNLDPGLLLAQDTQHLRQPHHRGTNEEADDEHRLVRLGGTACRIPRGLDLQQGESRMIEKRSAGSR